jgi:hypothetical protein
LKSFFTFVPLNRGRQAQGWQRARFSRNLRAHVSSEILGLGAAAAAAGLINAVAGGGTLLTFPTLLFYGTPPIVANATSTLALVIGTAGSIFGFRRQIGAVWAMVWAVRTRERRGRMAWQSAAHADE